MAALIGVAVPMNSVGRLPLDYLNATPKYQFQASCANLKQVIEQFQVKRSLKLDHSLPLLFREFADFTPEKRQAVENEVLRLAEQKRFDADAKVCAEWVTTVIRGLNLFHRYERVFLGGAIALSCQLGAAHVLVYHEKNERFKRCRLPTNKVRHGYRLRDFAAAIRSTPAHLQLRLLPASRLPIQRVLEHFVCGKSWDIIEKQTDCE
jgi:hypothetical protein